MNALKWTMSRDLRIVSYFVGILVIPINIVHGNWHQLFDDVLDLEG